MKTPIIVAMLFSLGCSQADSKTGTPNNQNNQNNVNNGNNLNNMNNGQTMFRGSDYDQTCTVDTDCRPIGTTCCGCPADAISSSETRYDEDRSVCDADLCGDIACEQIDVACGDEGLCRTRQLSTVEPGMFDVSCVDAADCVNVEPEPCSECRCGGLAINVDNLDDYTTWAEEQNCNPGPSPCDCVPVEVFCEENVCMTF